MTLVSQPSSLQDEPPPLSPNMSREITIRDLVLPDEDEDINDSDYEPQPSELGAADSDVSMLSSSAARTTISTDISIPSAIPSDAQSIADVSDIFPDDSVSQRDAKLTSQPRKYPVPPSEASETPSIVSFHSSGELHVAFPPIS